MGLSNDSVKDLLGSSATVTTIVQFLAGSLLCYAYILKKSTGETSGLPYTSGLLSCSMWLCYGILTSEKTVTLVNTVGVVLFGIYSMIYYVFTINKKRMSSQLLLVIIVVFFAVFYSRVVEPNNEKASRLIGLLCCSFTVFFFASPLIKLKHVIRTKNSESLPRPIIIASFFVTLQWCFYGYLINDVVVILPNMLGCILSTIQLALFVIYPSKSDVKYQPLTQVVNF
ncbi:unnamed protein product [Diamesa tonsa]